MWFQLRALQRAGATLGLGSQHRIPLPRGILQEHNGIRTSSCTGHTTVPREGEELEQGWAGQR